MIDPEITKKVNELRAHTVFHTSVPVDWDRHRELIDEEPDDNGWFTAVHYTEGEGDDAREHTLIVGAGPVVALWLNGRAYHRYETGEYADHYRADADDADVMAERDADALFDLTNGRDFPAAEGPVWPSYYPCPFDDPHAAAVALKGIALAPVQVDGESGVALTGGGMNMNWDIAAAFVALGFLPPAEIAATLPVQGDRGRSAGDQLITESCLASLEHARSRRAGDHADLLKRAAGWGHPAEPAYTVLGVWLDGVPYAAGMVDGHLLTYEGDERAFSEGGTWCQHVTAATSDAALEAAVRAVIERREARERELMEAWEESENG